MAIMPDILTEKSKFTFDKFKELHENQLRVSNVPEQFWYTVHRKLAEQVYDAGEAFQLERVEFDEDEEEYRWRVVVIAEEGLDVNDLKHIYLVDHAWTYQYCNARSQLDNVSGLADRMACLMDIADPDDQVEAVLQEMWRFNQTYTLTEGGGESVTYWYIMDEFGSRIQHSVSPTFRISPFFYTPLGISFTLLWPTQTLKNGDEVTRNFGESVRDPEKLMARLLPWQSVDLTGLSCVQYEPSDEYFMVHKGEETITATTKPPPTRPPTDQPLKAYIDVKTFRDNLSDPRFELVDDPSDADVLWCFDHWKDFSSLADGPTLRYINQFPGEYVVTMKHLLAVVGRRCRGNNQSTTASHSSSQSNTASHSSSQSEHSSQSGPIWLPVTYNLNTELLSFVSYFQNSENSGERNIWIVKPFNKSRGLDIHVTDNLNEIVRSLDTGPQVACRYIEHPVLFHRDDISERVKFDLRYIVLLHSVKPLKISVYKMFWLRFANKAFSLDTFDDYEKHFTVMNYRGNTPLKQMLYTDFISEFERQYPGQSWPTIQSDIYSVLLRLFEAAISQPYPRGIHDNVSSRAMYGADVMLQWHTDESGDSHIQPVLCEVNFNPDCIRACQYEPEFVNDIFAALFCDDINDRFTMIT